MELTRQEAEGVLNHLCPCRKSLVSTLLKYITKRGVTNDALFMYGNSGTGKTHVIKTLFDRLQVPLNRSELVCLIRKNMTEFYYVLLPGLVRLSFLLISYPGYYYYFDVSSWVKSFD